MDGPSRPLTRAQTAMSPGWWLATTLASKLRLPPHATSALCRRSCITQFLELTDGGTDTMSEIYRRHLTVRRDWEEAQQALSRDCRKLLISLPDSGKPVAKVLTCTEFGEGPQIP